MTTPAGRRILTLSGLVVLLVACNESAGEDPVDTTPVWDSIDEILIGEACLPDVDCDDDNPCTVDDCDPLTGCTHEAVDGQIECDGSLCTEGDSCQAGECVSGTPLVCTDPNPDDCIELICDAVSGECGTAVDLPQGHPCLDGNPCTDGDECAGAGICEGGPQHTCDAQHPCKTAWCNESAKEGTNPCVLEFLPAETPCDDGSLCTDSDACTEVGDGGALLCQGVPISCVDGNTCTLDNCQEETGCTFTSKSDGTACETPSGEGGTCQAAECVPSGDGCDDGVPCTVDEADPGGGCLNTPDDEACDDGLDCNGDETCDPVDGCIAGMDDDCDDGVACTVDTCGALGCSNSPDDGACDDGNPCTTDTCDPGIGCASEAASLPCDDGDACTTSDVCFGGQCSGGAAVSCDDGDPCTVDVCDSSQGCTFTPIQCEGECTPYAIEACYPGPQGTAGLGVCKAGHRQCLVDGSGWSPCYGAVVPAAGDLCGNGLDDDCDGTMTDETCDGGSAGVWVDWDNGDDTIGDGTWDDPYRTISKGISVGVKLVNVRADADGTVYQEKVNLGSSHKDIVVRGYGPTRPVLEGVLDIVHCYDCSFENLELRYPGVGLFETPPQGVIDAVHNYRNTFRDLLLTAPHGLPAGTDLVNCHHGYDNLFEDVQVDHLVLQPTGTSATFQLLNWNDHGSGSQFLRCRLGDDISVAGVPEVQLVLHFIRVGGYCGTYPDGVSAIRNCLAGNLDLDAFGAPSSAFYGFRYWCYTPSNGTGGAMIANNTLAHITATTIQGLELSISGEMSVKVTGNIFGPFDGESEIGINSNTPAAVTWSDLWDVNVTTQNQATLGAGVLSVDPMFQAPGDFHLTPGSPCINTGEPGWLDPDGSPADIGAYGGPFAE